MTVIFFYMLLAFIKTMPVNKFHIKQRLSFLKYKVTQFLDLRILDVIFSKHFIFPDT